MGKTFSPRCSVVFRCDGSPHIGLGHVSRCVSLATAIHQKDRGVQICFLLKDSDEAISRVITAKKFQVQWIPRRLDKVAEVNWITRFMTATPGRLGLVADSYQMGPDYLERLRTAGVRTFFVDDNALHPIAAAAVINPNIGAERLRYRVKQGTDLWLGPRYALLNPRFGNAPVRRKRTEVRYLLIALGGGDNGATVLQLLDWILALGDETKRLSIGIIVGTANKHLAALRQFCRKHSRCALHVQVPDMERWMRWADLGILSAGTTLLEAAAMRLPFMALSMADNQDRVAREWHRRYNVPVIAPHGVLTRNRFVIRFEKILRDAGFRTALARRAHALVDGRGSGRVAEALLHTLQGE